MQLGDDPLTLFIRRNVARHWDPQLVATMRPFVAKKFLFISLKLFWHAARIGQEPRTRNGMIMRNVVPIFLALIPLVAVVGACVAVP